MYYFFHPTITPACFIMNSNFKNTFAFFFNEIMCLKQLGFVYK